MYEILHIFANIKFIITKIRGHLIGGKMQREREKIELEKNNNSNDNCESCETKMKYAE